VDISSTQRGVPPLLERLGLQTARWMVHLEGAARLDPVVDKVRRVVAAVTESPARRAVLQGEPLSHSLHPVATMVPLGLWGSASVLDLLGGRSARPAAVRLILLGLVSTAPAVASGLAEFRAAARPQQRVAVVHAASNTTATTLFLASLLARRRRHATGVLLALAGNAVASVGGQLGGHLSIGRHVGSRHPLLEVDDTTVAAPVIE
jgi:uncharacterized membrane protein